MTEIEIGKTYLLPADATMADGGNTYLPDIFQKDPQDPFSGVPATGRGMFLVRTTSGVDDEGDILVCFLGWTSPSGVALPPDTSPTHYAWVGAKFLFPIVGRVFKLLPDAKLSDGSALFFPPETTVVVARGEVDKAGDIYVEALNGAVEMFQFVDFRYLALRMDADAFLERSFKREMACAVDTASRVDAVESLLRGWGGGHRRLANVLVWNLVTGA